MQVSSLLLPVQGLWKEDKNKENIKLLSQQKIVQDKKFQISSWEIVPQDDSTSSNPFEIVDDFGFNS